jgi:AraC-like DNA-binding protein
MNKFVLILILILVFTYSSNAGRNNTDSLKLLLPASKGIAKTTLLNNIALNYCQNHNFDSSSRYIDYALTSAKENHFVFGEAYALNTLGNLYIYTNNNDSAIITLNRAIELSKKTDSIGLESNLLCSLGSVYIRQTRYDDALELFKQALEITNAEKNEISKIKINSLIGQIYYFKGNYPEALNNFIEALKLAEKYNKASNIAINSNSIAIIYKTLKNNQEAKIYYQKGLNAFMQLNNLSGMANCYSGLADIQWEGKDYNEASELYQKALDLYTQMGDKYYIGVLYNNMAANFYDIKKYNESLKYAGLSLETAEEIGDNEGIVTGNNAIGKAYMGLLDYTKAEEFLTKGYEAAGKLGLPHFQKDAGALLTDLYEAKKEYKKSLNYFKIANHLKDSIVNVDVMLQISELQTKYETEKKDNLIKIQQLTIETKNRILYIALIFGVLISSALVIILFFNRKLNKSHRKLVQHNLELVEKQKLSMDATTNQTIDVQEITKYANSPLSPQQKNEIAQRLDMVMKQEQFYKEKGLTIDQLAKKIGTNRTYLSQVINDSTDKGFNTYVNQLRLEEARRILSDPKNDIPIKALYHELGFNSASTFYDAFRNFTGVTPLVYQKTILQLSN